jgi:hypothetical protein
MKLVEQRIELPRISGEIAKGGEAVLTESTMCCRWVAYRMCMALCRMSITCMGPEADLFWLRLQQTRPRGRFVSKPVRRRFCPFARQLPSILIFKILNTRTLSLEAHCLSQCAGLLSMHSFWNLLIPI